MPVAIDFVTIADSDLGEEVVLCKRPTGRADDPDPDRRTIQAANDSIGPVRIVITHQWIQEGSERVEKRRFDYYASTELGIRQRDQVLRTESGVPVRYRILMANEMYGWVEGTAEVMEGL